MPITQANMLANPNAIRIGRGPNPALATIGFMAAALAGGLVARGHQGEPLREFNLIRGILENRGDYLELTINMGGGNCYYLPYVQYGPANEVTGVSWMEIPNAPVGGCALFVTGPFSGCDFRTLSNPNQQDGLIVAHIGGKAGNRIYKQRHYGFLNNLTPGWSFGVNDVKFEWTTAMNAYNKIGQTIGAVVGVLDNANTWHFYYTRQARRVGQGRVYRLTHAGPPVRL
jgi:hypothetical protein